MDSGGVSDFLRQIPAGLIVIFCGSGLLLLITLGYVINLRSKRARGAVPPPVSAAPMIDYSDESAADLPDLDALASAEIMQPAAPPRPAGTFSLTLADGEMVDVVEMFTVMRHASDGGLIVRIGDKAYRNPPAVADADFKRRFHSTLRDLNSAQRPVEPKRASAEAAPADAEAEAPPIFAAPPESARLSPYEPAPGDLPKFKMPEGPPVKPKRGQRPVAEPIPEINIAASIETFLQHRLMKSGQYGNRSIHVRPALNGGVKIEVDGLFYESIGEVEDEGVRQYLAATIEEWQSRQ